MVARFFRFCFCIWNLGGVNPRFLGVLRTAKTPTNAALRAAVFCRSRLRAIPAQNLGALPPFHSKTPLAASVAPRWAFFSVGAGSRAHRRPYHAAAHCRWAGRPPKTLLHARLNSHPKPRHPLGLAAGTSHSVTETLQTPVFRIGKTERAAGKNTFTR